MTARAELPFEVPREAVEVYDDDSRYICGFGVRSSNGKDIYKVSYDRHAGHWVCSCRGGIFHGKCHHMEDEGLKGRKWAQQFGAVPEPRRGAIPRSLPVKPMPKMPAALTSLTPVIRRFRFTEE